jgi:NADH-quinone oxidoreductase subunit J
MSFTQVIFYLFAAIMLLAALRVITARNPVHAALYLVLTFISTSVLWMLLEAEFLAIALVLVYVGAVMVLFLFVVMMLDINIEKLREGFVQYLPVGALIAFALFAQMVLVIGPERFGLQHFGFPPRAAADYSNTGVLGQVIYSDYLYPFEIAAVILLVAIIAAISLAMRKRQGTKKQNPSRQIQTRKQDRLRIVKMKAEKQ